MSKQRYDSDLWTVRALFCSAIRSLPLLVKAWVWCQNVWCVCETNWLAFRTCTARCMALALRGYSGFEVLYLPGKRLVRIREIHIYTHTRCVKMHQAGLVVVLTFATTHVKILQAWILIYMVTSLLHMLINYIWRIAPLNLICDKIWFILSNMIY